MTKADAWMPFYVNDYLGDTMHLTTEQHGAYLLLLMAAWKRGGPLPNDDAQLAGVARMSGAAWRKVAPVVRAFFRVDGSALIHGRVEREVAKAQRLSDARRETGSKGGRPRKQIESEPKPIGFSEHNQNHNQTETPARDASHSHSPTPEDRPSGVRRGTRLPPDWAPSEIDMAYAAKEGLTPALVDRAAERFRNFWHAKAGKDAAKIDWPATWRNWVLEDAERRKTEALSSSDKALRSNIQ